MQPPSELADQPRTWIGRRSAVATVLSALLHLVLLLVFATATVQLVREPRRDVLPLVIREPAPLPLPGAPTAPLIGPPAAVVAPVVVPPVPQPVVKAPPRVEPKPAPKQKVAAKPKSAAPKPAPAPVAPPVAPPVAVAPEVGSGTGGAMGVAGGAAEGKAGGRLGGRGDDVFGVDQVAVRPAVIESPQPLYPAIARARHQEGTVVIEAVIDRGGRIEGDSLRVVTSQPPFDDPALDAFRRWRFKPGRDESGTAVRVRVKLPMRFTLR